MGLRWPSREPQGQLTSPRPAASIALSARSLGPSSMTAQGPPHRPALEPFAGRDLPRARDRGGARVLWNLSVARALRGSGPPRRGRWSPSVGRSSAAPARTPAARRTTSSSCATADADAAVAWGKVNRPIEPEQFDLLASAISSRTSAAASCSCRTAARGADPAFTAADSRDHRARLAQPVRPPPVHRRSGRAEAARRIRAAVHGDRRAELHRRSGAPRHQLRHVHRRSTSPSGWC